MDDIPWGGSTFSQIRTFDDVRNEFRYYNIASAALYRHVQY